MAGCCGALARLTLGVCVNIWQGNSKVVDEVEANMGLVRKIMYTEINLLKYLQGVSINCHQ